MFLHSSFSAKSFSAQSFYSGLVDLAKAAGRRLKRKRIIVDGKTYFLNPVELARFLTDRYAQQTAQKIAVTEQETLTAQEIAPLTVDYAAIKATADIRASQEFIARMNAEFSRLQNEAIRRKQLEEDDEECLMLLVA